MVEMDASVEEVVHLRLNPNADGLPFSFSFMVPVHAVFQPYSTQ